MQTQLTIKSSNTEIERFHNWFKEQINPLLKKEYRNRALLAAQEIVTNSVFHGNHENPDKEVAIFISIDSDLFTMKVTDEGVGIQSLPEELEFLDIDALDESGRGLKLIMLLCDNVTIDGNSIELTINLKESSVL